MKKKIVLLIFLLFFSCGGEEEVKLYSILGVWEIAPTINCQEYDCFGEDCSEADIPQKYSMTIEKSGNDIIALFHRGGEVNGPYVLKNKVNNTYTIYEFRDFDYHVEIWEFTATWDSNDLFAGEESWRYIDGDGYCREVSSLIGERF